MELFDDIGETVERSELKRKEKSNKDADSEDESSSRPSKRRKKGSRGRSLSSQPPKGQSPVWRSSTAMQILQAAREGKKSPAVTASTSADPPLPLTLPTSALNAASASVTPKPTRLVKGFRAPHRNKLDQERMKLPIYAAKDEIMAAVQANDTIIVISETGSGKTTQLPQYLLSSGIVGRGQVGCTQPRRVAAVSVAQRVSQEYGCKLGDAVGYSIRFDDCTSAATRIKYVTDGMLLREIILDPYLSKYNAMLLDEAHERTCNTDILFALLKQIQRKRKKILELRKERLQKQKQEAIQAAVAASPSLRGRKSPSVAAAKSPAQNAANTLGGPSPNMRPLALPRDPSQPISKAERKEAKKQRKLEERERRAREAAATAATAAVSPSSSSSLSAPSLPPFSLDDDTVDLDLVPNLQNLGELKLVVMSATLEAKTFTKYFDGAPVVSVEGRTHPVELFYADEAQVDYVEACMTAVLQIHLDWKEHGNFPGDILVFLTGSEEIELVRRALQEKVRRISEEECPIDLQVLSFYANLSAEAQMAAFEPAAPNTRKVILSTNLAETSLTIPGVRFVVDSGVVKLRWFDPARGGADVMRVVDVSQAEANQRSGRAGRDAPGVAYRLYTEQAYKSLKPSLLPEILRANLSSVVLQLKSLHVRNILTFDFLTPPSRASLASALEELFLLRALNSSGDLTPLGRRMVHFPLPPAWAKMLLKSTEEAFACSVEISKILAVMSVEGIFFLAKTSEARLQQQQRRQFAHADGDHFTFLDAFNAYLTQVDSNPRSVTEWCRAHGLNGRNLAKARQIHEQLLQTLRRLDLPIVSVNERETGSEYSGVTETDSIKKCLLFGLFRNVARRSPSDASYHTLVGTQQVFLHPSSVLISRSASQRPELLVFNVLVQTSRSYMRECMVLPDLRWLIELVPEAYNNVAAGGDAEVGALQIKGGKAAQALHQRLAGNNASNSGLSAGQNAAGQQQSKKKKKKPKATPDGAAPVTPAKQTSSALSADPFSSSKPSGSRKKQKTPVTKADRLLDLVNSM